MKYDPELENEQKDWCQAKRCRETSDIIYKRKGYCSYHFEEYFSLQKELIEDDYCDCDDCNPGGEKSQEVVETEPLYASIEEYKRATGKRFRMTKEQKLRGLSRDEAFKEFVS
jgi:hypothetical protein